MASHGLTKVKAVLKARARLGRLFSLARAWTRGSRSLRDVATTAASRETEPITGLEVRGHNNPFCVAAKGLGSDRTILNGTTTSKSTKTSYQFFAISRCHSSKLVFSEAVVL